MTSSFFVVMLLFPYTIIAWWDVGHMLTAMIAQLRLNQLDIYASGNFKELALAINNLCDNRTRTFVESSVWPDDIKGHQYSMDIWNQWHFIDTPYVTDAVIPVINYTSSVMQSVATVNQAKSSLKSNMKRVSAERALFARYLIHMVGDIHQPLHSVSLYNKTFLHGDAGGNLLKIKLLNGSMQNFHSFWDSGAFRLQNDSYSFRRPLSLQNYTQLKKVSQEMIQKYGRQVEQLSKNLDPTQWAKQSFLIAQNTTYPFMMKTNLATQQYTSQVYEVCKKRITLAGFRLANVVIDIFDPKGQHLNKEKINVKKGKQQANVNVERQPEQLLKQLLQHVQANKGFLQKFIKKEEKQNLLIESSK